MDMLFWKKDSKDKKISAKQMTNADYEKLGRSLEHVYLSGYVSTGRLIGVSILRGIGYGFGIFIGGTIVVAVLIWFLGQFETVWFLEPFVNTVLEAVQQGTPQSVTPQQ